MEAFLLGSKPLSRSPEFIFWKYVMAGRGLIALGQLCLRELMREEENNGKIPKVKGTNNMGWFGTWREPRLIMTAEYLLISGSLEIVSFRLWR
jgi:hypothetical protein